MNEQNLIPNSQRTREELQQMGRKGGLASARTRRKAAVLRKLVETYFEAYSTAYELTLADLAEALEVPNPGVLEWLIIELFATVPEPMRSELIREEPLEAMGITPARVAEIIEKYYN